MDAVEPAQSPDADPVAGQPVRLTGRDAFRLHLTLAAGLIVCCGAFAFELARALGGHSFSWMYVFEWPLFAAFAVYMWWNLLQGNDRVRRPPAPASGRSRRRPLPTTSSKRGTGTSSASRRTGRRTPAAPP